MITPSDDSTDWGMAATHRKALKEVASEQNCFIIVRPSEADTVRLIKDGRYGTKSMDVHDKSSTWGPMAGFVPLDQSLCKKVIVPDTVACPITNLVARCSDAVTHRHGYERPVHLYLSENAKPHVLLDENASAIKEQKVFLSIDGSTISTASDLASHPLGMHATFTAANAGGTLAYSFTAVLPTKMDPPIVEGSARANVTKVRFMITKLGDDYYAWWIGNGNELIPIIVWGYPDSGEGSHVSPVTGDYDLWMVVPHLKNWKQHIHKAQSVDRHVIPSVSSQYTRLLLQTLNQRCRRESLPVFNHGAEGQNFTFTQPIDAKLLLITPGKGAYSLENRDIPALMADMLMCGYLPIWNARYETTLNVPTLTGTAPKTIESIRDEIYKHIGIRLDSIEAKKRTLGNSKVSISSLLMGGRGSGLGYQDFRPEKIESLTVDAADYLSTVTTIVMQVNQAVVRDPTAQTRRSEGAAATGPTGETTYTPEDEFFIAESLERIGISEESGFAKSALKYFGLA